jgi:hypothetical protein
VTAAGTAARPPRVGVLTFHRCINYGSYWQARRLVEGLRDRGLDAVLLDHGSQRVDRAEWRCALQPSLPAPTPRSRFPAYSRKARRFFEAFAALPLSPRFQLDHPGGMEPCDVVVVGSDEVWNLRHPWYAGYPALFGDGLRADRVVSYAASFGSYDAAAGLSPDWAARLKGFAAISVRDENSRDIVARAVAKEPQIVLDPCLQFGVPGGTTDDEGTDYAAVYGHSFPDAFIHSVRRWAASRGARLISIGYDNPWADEQRLDAGPEAFASLMANARAVVTNYFHGCVFALANRKPFVCSISPYRSNKVRALAAQVGAQAHLVPDGAGTAALRDRLDQPLDHAVSHRIERLRAQSGSYLDAIFA